MLITITYRNDIVTATLTDVVIAPSIGVMTDVMTGVMTGVVKISTDQLEGIGHVSGEDQGTEIWGESYVEGAEIGITEKGEGTPAIKLEDGATILLTQSGGAGGKIQKITKVLAQMV